MGDRAPVASVTVVTVTYGDRWDYLKSMLAGLDALVSGELVTNVVIVANGAAAESMQRIEAVASEDHRIHVVGMATNLGSASGFGAGIAKALELGSDYLWLLDDDNLPEPGALAALVAAQADHGRLAAFQSLRPGHPSLPSGGARRQTLAWGLFGGFFASRAAFAAVGSPREDFVLYADDTEYTYRFGELGLDLLLVSDSVIADLEEAWWARSRRRGGDRSAVPGLRGGDERRRMYYAVRNSLFFTFYRVRERRMRLVAGVVAKSAALVFLTAVAAVRRGSLEPLRNLGVYVLASCHGLSGRLGPREESA